MNDSIHLRIERQHQTLFDHEPIQMATMLPVKTTLDVVNVRRFLAAWLPTDAHAAALQSVAGPRRRPWTADAGFGAAAAPQPARGRAAVAV